MKSKVKALIVCSLFVSLYSVGYAQDYYGNGGGSWRRRPNNNNQQQPKDKDKSISEPSGYLAISFGFATPEGTFAQPFSQGEYSEAAGTGYGNFALPGTVFHFSLGFPIDHSNFGFALMFGSYTNQYDINNYTNTLSPANTYNPYTNSPVVAFQSGGGQNVYSESSIMGGLFITYPIGRLSIDGRLMLGALLGTMPEQNVFAADAANDQLEYDVEPSNATSLAYDAGIGLRFMVAQFGPRKVCVMANMDYLYSNVSYNSQQDLYAIPSSGPNTGYQVQLIPSPSISGKLPIQMLNITLGIGYQF